MKRLYKFISAILIAVFLLNNLLYSSVAYAKETVSDTTVSSDKPLNQLLNKATNFTFWLLCQAGAVAQGDFINFICNNNEYVDLYKENTSIETDSDGNEYLVVDKSVTDYLLEQLQSYSESEVGYTLVPTVKLSYIKSSYFYSTDLYKVTCYLVEKYGTVGIYGDYFGNSGLILFDMSSSSDFFVVGSDNNKTLRFFKSVSSSANIFSSKYFSSSFTFDSSTDYYFEDSSASTQSEYRSYSWFRDNRDSVLSNDSKKSLLYKYMFYLPVIVSKTGFSYPVFDSLNDAVDYSMANGVYYATSDYTGQGQTITITSDTAGSIVNTDYSQMYDLLISMINENGSDLSYEELQALADSVVASLSEINNSIVSGDSNTNTLLQGILNKLSDFYNKYVPFSSGGEVTYTTVLTSIQSKLNNIYDTMVAGFDDMRDLLKSIRNWTIADTITDLADTLADWASFIKDLLDDVESGVAVIAGSVSDVADKLSTKFPFSIPWDIAFLIAFLADTPKAPVFEVPFDFPLYGIEYTFTFDMSQFEVVSKVSRLILTIIFSIGLLKLTNNIVSTKKR